MTIGPILKWSQNTELKDVYFLLIIFFIAIITSFLIIVFTKRNELILYLSLVSSLVLIFTVLFEIHKTKYRINIINFSRLFSHLGVGILLLSKISKSVFISK